VVTGAGETPELILEAECGVVGMHGDSCAMAKSLIELADMSDEKCSAMGTRGCNYVMAHYDRNELSERFLNILSEAIGR